MTATSDGEKQVIFSREVHGGDDVGYIGAADDQPRLFVNHPVVHLACFIVIFVGRLDRSAAKVGFEIGDRIFVKHSEQVFILSEVLSSKQKWWGRHGQ